MMQEGKMSVKTVTELVTATRDLRQKPAGRQNGDQDHVRVGYGHQ